MKQILVIEPAGKLYGSEMVLWDIISNKIDPELQYSVVLPPKTPLLKELQSIQVKTYDLLNIHNGKAKKFLSFIKLFILLKKKHYHVIFINQAGILRPISILCKLLKIPIVCEVSTLEDGFWVNSLNKDYYSNVKSFICNSQFISDYVHVPNYKKSTLYYGYQWKNLHPLIRKEIDPFHIILLGRISESKGHFLLVQAIKELQKSSGQKIKVFFVGDAPSNDIDLKIKSMIKTENLEDQFVFRGFQKNIEYEMSDKNLMVIPSIKEPFGRILCEAAEAKLPVIVAHSGGLGELSRNFKIGLSFEANNPIDLANKIEFAINNYQNVSNSFIEQSQILLRRLNMSSYIQKIELIINNAIIQKNSSIHWFGNN